MIYKDLTKAQNDFQWLFTGSFLNNLTQFQIDSYQYNKLLHKLKSIDDKLILSIVSSGMREVGIKELSFSSTISSSTMPLLALIPNDGMAIIMEYLPEGLYKCDTPDGLKYIREFHKDTLFAPIKLGSKGGKVPTAKKMFKDIALTQKTYIMYAAIASISINLFALATSLYSMQVYDRVIATNGISTLVALSVGVFIAIFLEFIIKISRSSILDYATRNMDIEYSHNIFERFLKVRSDALPKSIGTLSSQLQGYASVRGFISSAALYLIVDAPFSLMFLGAIILLGGFVMGGIVMIFLIISIIMGVMFRKKIENLSKTSSMASHKKLGLLVETVENAESIKSTGATSSVLNRWNALTQDAIDDDIEIKHYTEISTYLTAFFQQISYITLVATGAYMIATTPENMSMGALIAVTILSGRVLSPVAMIPNLFVQWGRAKMAINDLENVYKLSSDNDGIDRPLTPYLDNVNIGIHGMQFNYIQERPAINIPNLTIQEGEKIAILGTIGSGKSTFLKLLSGLYAPTQGVVYVNNIDMQQISRDTLNSKIGYLPQFIKLSAGTLRDNLTMGLIGISDEKIMEVAKLTGLISIINNLPQGLDSMIPEGGSSVSGGQKQIIGITRMVLSNPKVWLLDEPTASMDDYTERVVINLLANQMNTTKTLVIVTHKPILLGLVNRIIVLTPQGIAMDGPRDSVLEQLKNRNKPQQPRR
ncbi:MAG: ATP-binding cassette domain-containing protein [Sulfurovum sp.]|nr:MAG: ATP-binding cassette domain-containing protein [Sulfurovum sp.]